MPPTPPDLKRRAAAAALIAGAAALSHSAQAESSLLAPLQEATTPAQTISLYSNSATLVMGGFNLHYAYYGLNFSGTFKNQIVWYASTPEIGYEYWFSGGIASETYGLDLIPGVNTSPTGSNAGIGQLGERLAITIDGQLWSTDGTIAGSAQISDVEPWFYNSQQYEFQDSYLPINGSLYFKGRNEGQYELWRTDLTAEGTYQVVDINGTSSSSPHYLTNHNNQLFFSAKIGNPSRLWRSDGTNVGTQEVWDPGVSSGISTGLGKVLSTKQRVVFSARSALLEVPSNQQGIALLWSWNNEINEAELLTDDDSGITFQAVNLSQVGDRVAFSILNGDYDGAQHYSLWLTDGTSANTINIISAETSEDIHLTSEYEQIKGWNNQVFFNAANQQNKGLWVTDGTEQGTKELIDYSFDSAVSTSTMILHDTGVFAVLRGQSDTLWYTDGTIEGTIQVADLGQTDDVKLLNDKILFSTRNAEDDLIAEVWAIDLNTPDFAQIRLEMILSNFGATAFGDEIIAGDVTGDGRTDIADLNWVLRNWPGGEAPDISVPEPGTLAMLVLGAGLLVRRRRRG